MNKLRVLHIVPWFPNLENEIEGVFIAKHIQSLMEHCENQVLHIRFGLMGKSEFGLNYNTIPLDRITSKPFADRWRIKEWMASQIVKKYIKTRSEKFDLVNFHIAYPNAIKIKDLISQFPTITFLITEHWSAFHENFNLREENKGRRRIEQIFSHQVPLITVSEALKNDIEQFSGIKQINAYIVPNIIDTTCFKFESKKHSESFSFVSINNWNPMKNPFILIEAFGELIKKNKSARLILGGQGSLRIEMEKLVDSLNLGEYVHFKDRLSKMEVADLLKNSDAYIQSSNYETFSVICAEALATGTPVIATRIGGMVDFINSTNGILLDDLSIESLVHAMENMMLNRNVYDLASISQVIHDKFSDKKIGAQYYDVLNKIVNGK